MRPGKRTLRNSQHSVSVALNSRSHHARTQTDQRPAWEDAPPLLPDNEGFCTSERTSFEETLESADGSLMIGSIIRNVRRPKVALARTPDAHHCLHNQENAYPRGRKPTIGILSARRLAASRPGSMRSPRNKAVSSLNAIACRYEYSSRTSIDSPRQMSSARASMLWPPLPMTTSGFFWMF